MDVLHAKDFLNAENAEKFIHDKINDTDILIRIGSPSLLIFTAVSFGLYLYWRLK